jgi:hypothetical protein
MVDLEVSDLINNKIFTVCGYQVILDSDLAELYHVLTKNLNKAVKRNMERFPEDFMFQLTLKEFEILRFHSGTSSSYGGVRYLPCAFTEQGVAILSGILKSEKAIKMNIQIIRAFVSMRKIINKNNLIFDKFMSIDKKHLDYDTKFDEIFNLLGDKSNLKQNQGIFFDGQIYDSHKFVCDLIRSTKKDIILIDNYIDDKTLTLFSKRCTGVDVIIYTKNINSTLKLDLEKFNSQYEKIVIREFKLSHDRFMIIDGVVYHIGASLKDLGRQWFAFSKLDIDYKILLDKLN